MSESLAAREFADTELQWQHDTLSELIADLEMFVDPDPKKGTLASVEERLAFARTVYRRSIIQQDGAWLPAPDSREW